MIKDEVMEGIEYKYDVVTKYHSWKTNKCKFIMIHDTWDEASLENEVKRLSEWWKASCHYVNDMWWDLARIWMDNYILRHAGSWNLIKWYEDIMNEYAIWIENISRGTFYTERQVIKLYKLVKGLQEKHNIPNSNVIRHKDYTKRKVDITDNFFKIVDCESFEEWKEWKWLLNFRWDSSARVKELEKQLAEEKERNKKREDEIYRYLEKNREQCKILKNFVLINIKSSEEIIKKVNSLEL